MREKWKNKDNIIKGNKILPDVKVIIKKLMNLSFPLPNRYSNILAV